MHCSGCGSIPSSAVLEQLPLQKSGVRRIPLSCPSACRPLAACQLWAGISSQTFWPGLVCPQPSPFHDLTWFSAYVHQASPDLHQCSGCNGVTLSGGRNKPRVPSIISALGSLPNSDIISASSPRLRDPGDLGPSAPPAAHGVCVQCAYDMATIRLGPQLQHIPATPRNVVQSHTHRHSVAASKG